MGKQVWGCGPSMNLNIAAVYWKFDCLCDFVARDDLYQYLLPIALMKIKEKLIFCSWIKIFLPLEEFTINCGKKIQ